MKFKLHTIIMLCGPSCCGKTYYVQNQLIPQLRAKENGFRINIQYVASDQWRQIVLGDPDLDLRDPGNTFLLKYASEAAFRLLEEQVKQVTRFPVNAEFVIVDTTALNEDFRKSMVKIAKDHNYSIDLLLFDLPAREYYRYAGEADYVSKHVQRMRKEVFPNIGTRNYNQVLRIKDRENIDAVEEITDFDLYRRCHFPEDAVIVGDLHGCLEPLLKIEHSAKGMPLIVIGDVIDKGPESLDVLRHLKNNPEKYPIIVAGNHEHYVYRYLHGQATESPAHDYYTSITQYENNAEFRELVDWHHDTAVPFVKVRDSLFITHAPCENQFLGKVDNRSRRKQRYCVINEDTMQMIRTNADTNLPRHVFGHIAFRKGFVYKNMIAVDTGGVYGNMFSYYTKGRIQGFPAATTYSKNTLQEPLEGGDDPNDLESYELARLDYAVRQKINFVSGTIAPTASDVDRMKIEPIETAIEKFRSLGVDVIHVQKKYMGSRCEAYISRKAKNCRLTSRNGYLIHQLHGHDGNDITDLTDVYESIIAQPKVRELFKCYPDAAVMLLDGELMPWYAMGKHLIENQYQLIDRAATGEQELLESTGFEQILAAEFDHPNYAQYLENPKISDKIVNSNKKTTYKLLKKYRHVPVTEMQKYLQVYREQIAIYGSPREIEYCPFDILKIINHDGTEILFRDTPVETRYNMVSRDDGILVDLRNEKDVALLKAYFHNLPGDTEGLVLKCNTPGKSHIYMLKVRNEKYLTIIYGFDYLEPGKNETLIRRKNVSKKLSVSNREYELGWNLVEIPYENIHEENEDYKRILAGLIFEERKEAQLDPRL